MNDRCREPLKDVESIRHIVNDIAILAGLDENQLDTVFSVLQYMSFARGSFIFEKGDYPQDIYVILKGSVRLLLDIGGEYLEKMVFTRGQCFGETSVIGIETHTASIVAAEDTELILLSRKELFRFYKTDKDIFCMLVLNIAREACRRLNKTDEILLHYFAHLDHSDDHVGSMHPALK
ncbi:hypothetical protein BVX99_00060 [bacterium F16]|nr:hypothetical protein BVX99_00060 [bacterium F16]